MDNRLPIVGSAIVLAVLIGLFYVAKMQGKQYPKNLFTIVKEPQDIALLFPSTADELQKRVEIAIREAQEKIDAIIAIPDSARTFANTVSAFDAVRTRSDLTILANATDMLKMVSPDASIRTTAQKLCEQIEAFETEQLSNNQALYHAFKAYCEQKKAPHEPLTETEQYLLSKIMKKFKRDGLDLPQETQKTVRDLKNDISKIKLQFGTNIDQDDSKVLVSCEELAGLSDDFINNLKKSSDGLYIIDMSYATVSRVNDSCSVTATRQKVWKAFSNRAYPANEALLIELAAKRQQLAKLLNYDNYAAFDIDDSMAHTTQTVNQFLDDITRQVAAKENDEFKIFTKELPKGVTLTSDGKLEPWDVIYCKEYYKRNHLQLNENEVADYFPMEKTIDGLMKVYEQFFDLQFTKMPATGLWHDDITLLRIADRSTGKLLGYLILDLYPRENKYSHACQETIVPSISINNHADNIWVGMIIANFPPSTAQKPSLLKRREVEVFFHELGHALHSLFGRSPLGLLSGIHVKFDFVEVPSQMFEEWLYDPTVLKTVSSHYKTGEPLSDALIQKIIAQKSFDAGTMTQRQCSLAKLSLRCFSENIQDPQLLLREINTTMRPHVAWHDADHMYANFGHLTGYGSKYYTYLWSKVFALDLADTIKEHGFLNPEIGKKLKETILSKGGTQEPMALMTAFLGRQPNNNAFLRDMGLDV